MEPQIFKKYNFIAYWKESRKIQLQFATNGIKIGPLEAEIQAIKGARSAAVKSSAYHRQ